MIKGKLICIVDDEADICELVCHELSNYGFKAVACHSAAALQALLEKQQPELCIVDLGLPDADGTDLVKQLCQQAQMGVFILSGRSDAADRILGLELGADDYITKPFIPRELVARVNSYFRRLEKSTVTVSAEQGQRARFASWQYDPATLTLTSDVAEAAEFSAAEHELLMALLKAPKKILTRDQLLGERASPFDRSIDVRMSRIRKKIEHDPKQPSIIKTVYGVGYILTTDVQWY